jgi:hypothetical protein
MARLSISKTTNIFKLLDIYSAVIKGLRFTVYTINKFIIKLKKNPIEQGVILRKV